MGRIDLIRLYQGHSTKPDDLFPGEPWFDFDTGTLWIGTEGAPVAVGGGGVGTVTDVDVSSSLGFLTTSGGPVVTTGTISIDGVSVAGNLIVASPDGTSGPVSARAMVAADIPALDASKITTGTIDAGRLPTVGPGSGGTGLDTSAAPSGSLLIGNGSGLSLNTLTAGTNVTIDNTTPGHITITATGTSATDKLQNYLRAVFF